MTDTLTDDDIAEVRSTRSTTTSSTTTRRPMYIETELRTDSVTTRRMASAAANRSVQEVLENTKSPTHDRQSTTYTYAHSAGYAPTRSTTYDVPVMARRDLHDENQSLTASLLSLPCRLYTNARDQLSNGCGAVRDCVNQLTGWNQTGNAGTRSARTSSQSSSTGSRSTGYNLRSRPVHSTPREADAEQHQPHQRKVTKHRKDHTQHADAEEEEEGGRRGLCTMCHTACDYFKKFLHLPIDIFDAVWTKLRVLPWWILLPLLALLTIYLLPCMVCKPFEKHLPAKVNTICRDVQNYQRNTKDFVRRHTYDRGVRNIKRVYNSMTDIKNSVWGSLNDMYSSIRNRLKNSVLGVRSRVADVVESTTDNAKEYYDAGIQKVNKLIEELKQEREKVLGARHALKPDQEQQLTQIVRQLIDEYAADETGQADFALESNGGKVVDTRCQEYTDEPRQNVVKFLGIPIVHMSKQPDIIIKHGRMPGQCFPFKGDHGSVVIRLAVPVIPTEFVLEHLSKSISIVGHINSAPNNFTVYALKDKNDKEGIVLGRYYYDAENGPALQRFKPQIANAPVVEFIEVQITSNWGNPVYTCLYRFRVHGDLQSIAPTAA